MTSKNTSDRIASGWQFLLAAAFVLSIALPAGVTATADGTANTTSVDCCCPCPPEAVQKAEEYLWHYPPGVYQALCFATGGKFCPHAA